MCWIVLKNGLCRACAELFLA
uniref:Uncharacterized protein n=1 Tax=Arundo donax TaxID=35708 RepID=A0A0A9BNK3_ARUDO